MKSWDLKGDETAFALLKKWHEIGVSVSAAAQRDTPEQKQILCELIDVFKGEIQNDFDGETYTKEQAKKYIMEF